MEVKVYKNIQEIPKEILEEISKIDIEGIKDYFSDPFTFNIGIVYDSNREVIGVGIVRVVNEFKIALKQEITNIAKAKSINKLFKEALINMQCNEAIVEITIGGEHYKNILREHFNFQSTYGEVLRFERQ